MGEFFDEADRVGEEHLPVVAEGDAPRGGVQRGKEAVFDGDIGAGEGAHQGGFARVGIADEGYAKEVRALFAGNFALFGDAAEGAFENRDAAMRCASIHFELGFARSARAHAARASGAACLARQVRPLPGQSGQHVDELGQLDLGLRFAGLGAAGKDVEDEAAAVDDFDFYQGFEIAGLCGREVFVKDDDLGAVFCDSLDEFFGFAAADEIGGVLVLAFLKHFFRDHNPCGVRQEREFVEGVSRFAE